ncbi:MAG: hypothetical protein J2P17_15440, partial [Mycobacterium sp.]|nr:hypothetical protein [Mycobacterium sp.]
MSSPDFSGGSLAPWIGQGVSLANGGALVFPVPSTVGATAWTIDHVVNMGTDRGTNPGPWSLIYVDANRLFPRIEWSIDIQPANISGPAHDQLNLVFYVVTGPDTSTATTLTTQDHGMWDGLPHHLRLSTSQSGSNISWSLYADGQQFSGTVSSQTLQAPTGLEFNPQEQQTPTFLAGQAAVWSTATPSLSAADAYSATSGWAGELATARLARLCAEEGVPLTLSATASHLAMGPQRVDTLLNLLRECEAADGGILFDGLTAGLNYLSYPDRVNQAVALALDTKRRQVKLPFAPIEDDQRVRNDMTVTRPNGSFARVTDPVHIAANGLYDSSATRNVQFDSMLANQAGWAVRLGTVPEMRVPGVSLQLIDHPELWAAWLATTLGERITAANLPAQYPPGVLDMILEGYTETWDSASWRVDLNTSPYAPWIAATLNGLFRLEMVGQSLGAGLAPGATSLTLATSAGHQLFTTSAQYPADFPVDLNVGGWPVRVTATSSPLTDAFGRTVSNGWGNADTGQAWTIGSGSTADFSVGSGTGKQSHAAVNSLHAAQLNLGSSDVDYTVDVSVPIGSAVGASVTQWVIGRLSDL